MIIGTLSPQTEKRSIEQALDEAVALHQAGQLQPAEERYRAILQIEPNHPKVNHNLGVLHVQLGQPAVGMPFFSTALDADPAHGQYWLSYIDALYQAGQVEEARQVLVSAQQLGLQGDDVDALALRLEGDVVVHGRDDPELPCHGELSGTQEIDTLLALFTEGRYKEAENLAQMMTLRFPRHEVGWKMLGVLFSQKGQSAEALIPMQKAVALSPSDAEAHNNLGIILQDLGRLDEAVAAYRCALEVDPGYARANGNLGSALQGLGRLNEAVRSYTQAIRLNPDYARAHNNLGSALQELGRLDEAVASYRRALQLDPNNAEWYFSLGNIFKVQGKLEHAEACYQCALQLRADYAEVYGNLGVVLKVLGRLDAAENCYRRLLEIRPEYTAAHNNLGSILQCLGRPVEAEASYRRAIQIDQDCAEAHCNLGNILQELGRSDEAEVSLRHALQIKPDYAQAHNNLGVTLKFTGRLKEAESCFRRALQIAADLFETYSNLGATLMDMGRLTEAETNFRQALQINPDYFQAHSNLLFVMNYASNNDPAYGLAEAKLYGQRVSSKVTSRYTEWSCDKLPDRLRIGFVSGDFRNHPVGYFLESVLQRFDPAAVELFAYPTHYATDEITARLKPCFAAWRPLFGKSDEAAARQINSDNLHVLIDLSGHTQHNRLPVFAWKPAPVQISWQGYLATTGVAEIDYFLGDPYVAPIDEADHFSEKIWQLPECYMCFTKPEVTLDVAPLPALSIGHITFGSLNNLTKMNDATVALWARVLASIPGSRLLLKTKLLSGNEMRESVIRRYAQHGIPAGRLILEGAGTLSRAEYLASYHRIDIALDPFPYSGCTTSIEGLWMGVPLLTKRGDRFESHLGETIDHNAGLPDWIAADDDDSVAKAIYFSSDLERLAALRAGLRNQVLSSPLFDATCFARNLEEALWGMWQQWLERSRLL